VSKSSATTKAQRLKAVMLDYGVPEVSIELQTGRPNPYDTWDALFVVADMSHHIVSNYNPSNLTPLLWLVKAGRTSVPGPLANGYGGWDLCYRILCFSYANHPGAGGPRTVPRAGGGTFTIPKDSARRYVWGTEYEGGVVEADWDRLLRNPRNGRRMMMREFMGRAGAAIHDYFNIPSDTHMEHSTWAPLRKIDRLHYNASEGKTEERRYADAPPPEDDMPTANEIAEAVWAFKDYDYKVPTADGTNEWTPEAFGWLARIENLTTLIRQAQVPIDYDALATAIVGKLPNGGSGSIDLATVKQGVREVLREGVGDAPA
jgi:hypothetical protein